MTTNPGTPPAGPIYHCTALAVARKLVRNNAHPDLVIAYLTHELHAGTDLTPPGPCQHCHGITQSDRIHPDHCSARCAKRTRRTHAKTARALRLLALNINGRDGICPHPHKRGYLTENSAVTDMNTSPTLSRDPHLRAYHCTCDQWHLGHWRKPKPHHQRPIPTEGHPRP